MLTLQKVANIHAEMERIFNSGDSEFLSNTIVHKEHELCNLMETLNSEYKLYQSSFEKLEINSLKVDDQEVIGFKEKVKKSYGYNYTDREFYIDTEKIFSLANPAPFGKGTETVYDEDVRKAFEITADRIDIDAKPDFFKINNNIIPIGKKFVYKLYKMQIYKT